MHRGAFHDYTANEVARIMLQANLPTAIATVETNGKASPHNKLVVKWFSA